ncbi:hypothetical protein D1AOALGA4SA_6081 [Olavius algarvensis Delta 1 endosymbiont]|nr:hypothetical protein D1AOALGA4SA_6081 [Olavius algarvensis Delta 1 endosymbiont]
MHVVHGVHLCWSPAVLVYGERCPTLTDEFSEVRRAQPTL